MHTELWIVGRQTVNLGSEWNWLGSCPMECTSNVEPFVSSFIMKQLNDKCVKC
jgi:hypothetical protein